MWTLINGYPKEHDMLAQSWVKLTATLHDIFVLWKSDIIILTHSLIHFYVLAYMDIYKGIYR